MAERKRPKPRVMHVCPSCGRAGVTQRENGTLRTHRDQSNDRCEGTGKEPNEVTIYPKDDLARWVRRFGEQYG